MRALVTACAQSKMWPLDVLVEKDFVLRTVLVKSVEEGKNADIPVLDFGAAECGRRRSEAHEPTTESEALPRMIERWRDGDRQEGDGYSDPAIIRYPFADLWTGTGTRGSAMGMRLQRCRRREYKCTRSTTSLGGPGLGERPRGTKGWFPIKRTAQLHTLGCAFWPVCVSGWE